MNGEILQSVTEETDLGIIVSNDLKPSKQCVSAVKKAYMKLGMIKRHIVSRDKNTIVRLNKSLVRPKLEYCIQAWNPSLIKDIELLEQVQHRARASVRRTYAVYYVQKSAAYAEITHQRRTADF